MLAGRPLQRIPGVGGRRLPRLLNLLLRNPDRLPLFQAIPQCGIANQRLVAALAHALKNPAHRGLDSLQPRCPPFQLSDRAFRGFALEDPHHITTLFSGYSTMPVAFAAFSRGITSQHRLSSRMVFTATHALSLSVEMVGTVQRGKHGQHRLQVFDLDVEHQSDTALRFHRAAQHQRQVLDLLPLAGVGPGFLVGDDLGVGFEKRFR